MAHIDADIVALQEVLLEPRDQARIERLLADVASLGPRYRMVVDDCPRDAGRQHVAFWIREGIDVLEHADVASMNAIGGACDGHLRPGLQVRIGQRGATFNFVNVHLDSGVNETDFLHRDVAFRALADAHRFFGRTNTVWLGDFNTMGCRECQPAVSSAEEIDTFARYGVAAGFAILSDNILVTHRSGRHRSRLDHVLISRNLRGWATGNARSLGPCSDYTNHDDYFERVSDHCPTVFELRQ